jgi:hypothetical protein
MTFYEYKWSTVSASNHPTSRCNHPTSRFQFIKFTNFCDNNRCSTENRPTNWSDRFSICTNEKNEFQNKNQKVLPFFSKTGKPKAHRPNQFCNLSLWVHGFHRALVFFPLPAGVTREARRCVVLPWVIIITFKRGWYVVERCACTTRSLMLYISGLICLEKNQVNWVELVYEKSMSTLLYELVAYGCGSTSTTTWQKWKVLTDSKTRCGTH